MAMSVRLSDEIITVAKKFASVMDRSCAGQIEYWTKIGKMAEENPDLPYSFIKDILLAKAELETGEISDYEFSK